MSIVRGHHLRWKASQGVEDISEGAYLMSKGRDGGSELQCFGSHDDVSGSQAGDAVERGQKISNYRARDVFGAGWDSISVIHRISRRIRTYEYASEGTAEFTASAKRSARSKPRSTCTLRSPISLIIGAEGA